MHGELWDSSSPLAFASRETLLVTGHHMSCFKEVSILSDNHALGKGDRAVLVDLTDLTTSRPFLPPGRILRNHHASLIDESFS